MSRTLGYVATLIVIASVIIAISTGYTSNQEKEQLAKVEDKEVVSSSIVPMAETPTNQPSRAWATVYSFYDTQLEVVCFITPAAMQCMPKHRLSDHAKTFINDRLEKAKDNVGKVGELSIIPRIISLDK